MSGTKRNNLAARMGGWSAQHRKIAILGWFAFVLVAFALGNATGTTEIDQDTSGVGESGRADRILDAGFKLPAAESVLVQSNTLVASDPSFQSAVEDVVARVSKFDEVKNVRSPLEPGNAGQIAEDGRAALVEFDIRGDSDDAADKIDSIVAAVGDVQKAHPQLFIGEFGDASIEKEIDGAFGDDLKKAGILSLPVTLIILALVFGALVAAGIPLLLALTGIIATFGLVALPSSIVPLDQSVEFRLHLIHTSEIFALIDHQLIVQPVDFAAHRCDAILIFQPRLIHAALAQFEQLVLERNVDRREGQPK